MIHAHITLLASSNDEYISSRILQIFQEVGMVTPPGKRKKFCAYVFYNNILVDMCVFATCYTTFRDIRQRLVAGR